MELGTHRTDVAGSLQSELLDGTAASYLGCRAQASGRARGTGFSYMLPYSLAPTLGIGKQSGSLHAGECM